MKDHEHDLVMERVVEGDQETGYNFWRCIVPGCDYTIEAEEGEDL